MVLASYIRLALVGAALLFSHAQATFDFSSCADNCVTSSGCESDSARCMCKEAREVLLDSVISCLFFNCKDDLRNFDDAFLAPIEEGCVDSGRDIPRSKLRAAESLASSYIDKLPSPTTAKSTPVEVTPTPKPTKKADPTTAEVPPSSTTAEDSSPSSSSTVNRQPVESKSTAAAVTPAAVPTPATQSSATPSESPASDDSGSGRSGGGGGGDPFSTTGGSVGSAIQPFLALLGLPVVAALLALE